MKRILCSALALVLALSLCACGESGGDTGPTYPAAFAGLEDQIDAAREEGRLTVCVSGDEPFLTAACEKFEELFDINVTVRTAEPDALPNGSGADVWYGGDEALCRALSESGGLMAYTPEAASALIDPGYGHEDYCAINSDALGIMVNSDVLARMGISAPRNWDDLLEPVYRELVWLPAYDTAEGRLFVRAMMEYFGDDAADYLTQLDTSVQFYTTGTDTAAKCLSTGECVIGIGWLSTGLTAQRKQRHRHVGAGGGGRARPGADHRHFCRRAPPQRRQALAGVRPVPPVHGADGGQRMQPLPHRLGRAGDDAGHGPREAEAVRRGDGGDVRRGG